MMRKIVEQFVKFPIYANLIIFVFMIGGIIGLVNLKMSFFPERSERDIRVSVSYPGASPKEMEEAITDRVEQAIRSIAGIKEINSTSSENFSMVQVTTTGEYDIDETLAEVKNAVDGISSFPVDAEKPVVAKIRSSSNAAFLALTGNDDLMMLKKYADRIEEDFYASGLMSQISISGYPPLEMAIEISEEDLLRYGLSHNDLMTAVFQNNQDIMAGTIRSEKEEILIQSRSRSVDPETISNIVIKANPDGSFLQIKDVATVNLQFSENPQTSLLNGTPSITISIRKLAAEDLADISEFVNNYVEEFNKTTSDAELLITFDFLSVLKQRLNLLKKNGGIGLLLVLIALGLFLNLRLSFWVAFGIPISFAGMFIAAAIAGITINMMSIFGMILVIGILVDDGIVIAENIYAHYESGKSTKKAAVDGTVEVLPAVLVSVTTTIIAFSPLFFLEGRMEFLKEMAFVVVFSLFFSLFEAFFVLSAHLSSNVVMRDRGEKKNRVRAVLDRFLSFMRDKLYSRLMDFTIKWRHIFLVFPVALIIITVGLFRGGQIKATFFPSIPFDQFNINIAFVPGSGEAQTLKYLQRFEKAVWEVNEELLSEHKDTINYVSHTSLNTGAAFDGVEVGGHAGNIFVLLRSLEGTGVSSFEIVGRVSKKIGEIPEAEKFTVAGRNTFGNPVSISLLGSDMNELNAAKKMLLDGMRDMKQLNNVTDDNATGKREVKLKLKPKAYFLGLTQSSITSQVRMGFFGGQAQRLQSGKDEIRVWVRYPKDDRMYLGQLEDMKIRTRQGEYPLSELADYTIERGPVNIKHFNLAKEVRVNAELVNALDPVPPILNEIKENIVSQISKTYPNIKIEYQGQSRDSNEAQGQLGNYFSIAFFMMFLMLIIHFKSFSQGLIIILMIPLGWLGAIWGHGIEGHPISMLSAWGMVALSGVIINDAVVFLQKYNQLVLNGMKVKDAVKAAGIARFRAIILTTITTTVGLYPLILEKSFQAQFLIPMAIALAYGVFIGTAFILTFFPLLILFVNDVKSAFIWLWTAKRPNREQIEKINVLSKRTID